jgi:NAD(P)-dependent dehydrogenase (short-subunit alcohol dehydrogenase family)
MSLAGKVAIVTGAAGMIGSAISRTLIEAGADVALADISMSELQGLAEDLSGPGRALAIETDCSTVAGVQALVDRAVEELGRVDILVNNAGITFQVDILALTEAEWDRVNNVNLKGAFFALQRAAQEMVAQGEGGRIINIASISGRGYAKAANPAYSASKGGLISLTQVAADRLGPFGINVNAICPGLTITKLLLSVMDQRAALRGITPEEVLAEFELEIPSGRANRPEDIAAMVLFLVDEGGRNITGQAYNVDGGTMKN